jgi:hypothetical protein
VRGREGVGQRGRKGMRKSKADLNRNNQDSSRLQSRPTTTVTATAHQTGDRETDRGREGGRGGRDGPLVPVAPPVHRGVAVRAD